MTVDSSPLFLLDAEKNPVPAELLHAIGEQQLADWEDFWKPETDRAVARLKEAGVARALWPQSRHWDWRAKTANYRGALSKPGFCVVCDGVTQGLMFIDTLRSARAPSQSGKSIIYVDFLEVAPWNRRDFPGGPRYTIVGSALLRAAIELSISEDCKGRIGLHSLPQSDNWYANVIKMIDLGRDPGYQNLRYFEVTPEIAQAFIAQGLSP